LHCAVGEPVFGITVYGDPNRKPTIVLTNDLNAADGFTSVPVPDGIKAFFSQRRIVQSEGDRFLWHISRATVVVDLGSGINFPRPDDSSGQNAPVLARRLARNSMPVASSSLKDRSEPTHESGATASATALLKFREIFLFSVRDDRCPIIGVDVADKLVGDDTINLRCRRQNLLVDKELD
jgi:hypothetical protein